jgi:hypothetical protein
MAKKENAPDMPLPSEGGSYIRDDQTGKLTRAETKELAQPAASAANADKE